MIGLCWLIFWAGKKFVTLPRLGQVKFGAERHKRKRTLAAVLVVIVAFQTLVVLSSVALWANPELAAGVPFLSGGRATDVLVASLGALFVGPSLALVAYFNDFLRGYYIALVMSAAVFLMIWFDQPDSASGAAALIFIPGLVLFVRFLPGIRARRPRPAMDDGRFNEPGAAGRDRPQHFTSRRG